MWQSSRQDKSANKCFDVFLLLSLLLGSCQSADLKSFLSLLWLQSGSEIKSTWINLWPLRWWCEWGFGPSWGCWLSALDNGCHRLTSCHNPFTAYQPNHTIDFGPFSFWGANQSEPNQSHPKIKTNEMSLFLFRLLVQQMCRLQEDEEAGAPSSSRVALKKASFGRPARHCIDQGWRIIEKPSPLSQFD